MAAVIPKGILMPVLSPTLKDFTLLGRPMLGWAHSTASSTICMNETQASGTSYMAYSKQLPGNQLGGQVLCR